MDDGDRVCHSRPCAGGLVSNPYPGRESPPGCVARRVCPRRAPSVWSCPARQSCAFCRLRVTRSVRAFRAVRGIIVPGSVTKSSELATIRSEERFSTQIVLAGCLRRSRIRLAIHGSRSPVFTAKHAPSTHSACVTCSAIPDGGVFRDRTSIGSGRADHLALGPLRSPRHGPHRRPGPRAELRRAARPILR